MGDVQAMEHAYSHVLGELWGAVISTAIVFLASLFFCWQLSIAAFWSIPVAFAVLFATRKPMKPVFERNRAAKVKVTQGIRETLIAFAKYAQLIKKRITCRDSMRRSTLPRSNARKASCSTAFS